MSAVSETTDGLTVDQVARLTGTTVRTIRWYQSEGLLPAPRRAGRTARYDADHVQRLEAIRDLQAHGLTLVAIRRLLERAPDTAANALAFVQAAVSPASKDEVEVIDAAEGAARLGAAPTPALAAHLESLGVIRVLPDGRWELPAPALFRAAEELAEFDFPLEQQVEIVHHLRAHTEEMARILVDFFVEHFWPGREDDPEAWAEMTAALGRLRPLATTSVVALLDTALARAAERATERQLGHRADPAAS
ncbi:MAG TPA: MerR family transcriptional regulator [Acidimicrobiales bacterium]